MVSGMVLLRNAWLATVLHEAIDLAIFIGENVDDVFSTTIQPPYSLLNISHLHR
jgi:hypothetical protein